MIAIPFYKMSGSGNDFIVIDNRRPILPALEPSLFVARVCRRGMALGADGLILVESSETVDFQWRFFNSDGSVAEMCGNGARCAARFAFLTGIAAEKMAFETLAGIIRAEVRGDQVRVQMSDPRDLILDQAIADEPQWSTCGRVNTGVPHAVFEVADVGQVDVTAVGRRIRWLPCFAPAGTNVNFIAPLATGRWAIRTYERGVEDETLACGTGNVAAALLLAGRYATPSPLTFETRGGSLLTVHFRKTRDRFDEVYLEGDARVICTGMLNPEAWQV
jgi:diaminopimelate epimerase